MAQTALGKDSRLKKEDVRKILSDPSLKASIQEGAFTSLMVGAGENFLSPYIIFLKASNLQIGLLSSVPLLLGSVAQLLGVWLSGLTRGRLHLILQCVLTQALVWVPLSLLYGIFGAGDFTVWLVILLYTLYFVTGSLGAPAWNSLIGDLAPASTRGRFFGIRNERGMLAMCGGLLGGGALLQKLSEADLRGLGFFILFMIAFLARMCSLHFLTLHRDPPYKVDPKSRFSYFEFIKRSPKSNFAKFVFFLSTMSFAVMISGPFFAVYMLDVLHYSYFEYTLMTVTPMVAMFLTMRYWGWLADRYGNKSILRLCAIGVSVNPFMWLVSGSLAFVMLIQMWSGVVWAGYNLAAGNFLFDAVTPQKRARCVAYQSITNAIFIFLGTLAGALLLKYLPDSAPFARGIWTTRSPYLRIFYLSGLLRLLACYYMLPTFRGSAGSKIYPPI